jgi:hypothetical protein
LIWWYKPSNRNKVHRSNRGTPDANTSQASIATSIHDRDPSPTYQRSITEPFYGVSSDNGVSSSNSSGSTGTNGATSSGVGNNPRAQPHYDPISSVMAASQIDRPATLSVLHRDRSPSPSFKDTAFSVTDIWQRYKLLVVQQFHHPWRRFMLISFLLSLLYTVPNYLWYVGMPMTSIGMSYHGAFVLYPYS